ncbi:NmrA-like family domain-containing protein [Lachnellula hyalina]|uniref:NmrA-like family domain-containing protein n=1 Tax=Lachnellula hyalina TaxID=1316788 RepID=A0A8H8R0W5_9HELO|nr:NmrA-like family domain-containing protein [Lachnellula hyalina]TVY25626.1 NmrA-like family domain-containing protein [Lachnellula hyalina]
MPTTYLITGATGYQGGSTARQLLSHGHRIHAFVRNPSSPAAQNLAALGATLFKGDYSDLPSIIAATKGVSGVFLNTFPDFQHPDGEVPQAQNFVTAAREAGTVTSFVVSTVFKSKENLEFTAARTSDFPFLARYYRSKAGVEDVVLASGIKHVTILRPTGLGYQYLSPYCLLYFPEYPKEHFMTVSYAKEYRQGHLDPEDVGKFAAAAFLQPEKFGGKTIELVKEVLTFDEIVAVISRVSGVKIGTRYRSQEETRALVLSGKFPVLETQMIPRRLDYEKEVTSFEEYGIQLGTLECFLEREKLKLLETLGVKV